MRKELHRLAEAVRALRLTPTGQPAPDCVRLGIAKDRLPEALLELHSALEAVDAAGGVSTVLAPTEDVAKLRQAVDGVLRFVKMRGIGIDEAEDIVRDALGKGKKRRKRLEPLPVFAPNGWKRRKGFKPMLKIDSDSRTLSERESDVRRMRWVWDKMGEAAAIPTERAPRPEPAPAATAGGSA